MHLNMRYLPYFQLLILLNDFPVHKANVWLFVYKFWLPFDVVLPFPPILDPWPDILLCFRPIVWWRHPKRWTIDHVPVGSNFAPHVLDQAICWGQKKISFYYTIQWVIPIDKWYNRSINASLVPLSNCLDKNFFANGNETWDNCFS